MPGRNKFPRSLSLKSRLEITGLLQEGQRFTGNCFSLVWRPQDRFAWCVLVSTRLGSAPERNRVKRLFREAIRLCKPQLPPTGLIAILPRAGCQKLSFDEISTDVRRIAAQLR